MSPASLASIIQNLTYYCSSWLDRIPFTLLFGISTSVELFEGRLPRSTVALLRGKYFEIHDASNCVDRIYERLQADPSGRFWLGRNITAVLFERSNDYFQTPEAFSRVIKVSSGTSYSFKVSISHNNLAVFLHDPLFCEPFVCTSCNRLAWSPSKRSFVRSNQKSSILSRVSVLFRCVYVLSLNGMKLL